MSTQMLERVACSRAMSVDVGEDVGEFTDDGFWNPVDRRRKQVPDRGEGQPARDQPPDAEHPGEMIEAVVARAPPTVAGIEQTEVVVVTDRANGGVGQVRELGDLHASIVRCDVTSQSRSARGCSISRR